MTPAQQWLNAKAYGYADVTSPERQAINEFSLLWSLFEEWVLDNDGSNLGDQGEGRRGGPPG